MLQEFLERFSGNKEKLREFEGDLRMQKIAHDKLKSSNERELERYFRQKREEAMAKQLAAIRKNQTREMMTGNVFANNKNLFSGHKSVLNDDSSLFTRSNL